MTTITDEFMKQMLPKAKEYVICILKAGPKRNQLGTERIIWKHGRRNFQLRADGVLSTVVNGLNDNYLNITASMTKITTGTPTYFPWSYQPSYTNVTFTVTTIAGAPVSDARVTVTLNGDSLGLGAFSTATNSTVWEPSSSSGITNGDGQVILSIPQTSGTITANASKNGYYNASITLSGEIYCFSSNSETSNINMSLSEAMKIITEKIFTDIEFGNQGKIRDAHIYSCMTDTWWIDMKPTIEKKGCGSAYVVNVITKVVEINWRC